MFVYGCLLRSLRDVVVHDQDWFSPIFRLLWKWTRPRVLQGRSTEPVPQPFSEGLREEAHEVPPVHGVGLRESGRGRVEVVPVRGQFPWTPCVPCRLQLRCGSPSSGKNRWRVGEERYGSQVTSEGHPTFVRRLSDPSRPLYRVRRLSHVWRPH